MTTTTAVDPGPFRTRHHHTPGGYFAHALASGANALPGCAECAAEDDAGAVANITAGCRRAFSAVRLDGEPADRVTYITDDPYRRPGEVVSLAGARWQLVRRTR